MTPLVLLLFASTPVEEPAPDTPPAPVPAASRPFVRGGIYDKPFLVRGRMSMGGYVDAQGRFARTDGITEESTFLLERFNLFAFTPVSERVRVAAELEIEEGGEEVTIETAIVDIDVHEALSIRGGIVLTPLGRFNLAHDSPANDLVDRPLVSTEILGATLSEPGLGVWGAVHPRAESRVSYELYLVNGFDDRLLLASPDGTRISEGKGTLEDANAVPSTVGRVGLSPVPWVEVGLSGHRGPYNVWKADGVAVDRRRDVAIAALDLEVRRDRWMVVGEWARAWVEVPRSLRPINASVQEGFYLEGRVRFLAGALAAFPEGAFVAAARVERVDFDADRRGDDLSRATIGMSFRPTEDTAIKLDLQHSRARDRFALEVPSSAVLLGLATYF